MKAKLTNFYCSFFGSKILEKACLILVTLGVAYWIIECAITIIQKP
jgi:hypothetical protein